jgi:hypothetical protein
MEPVPTSTQLTYDSVLIEEKLDLMASDFIPGFHV